MGDVGDDFRAMKDDSKVRRADNRQNSTQMLTDLGVKFESKNAGAHLIIDHPSGQINFWPGTGLWHARTKKGRGVKNLIKYMVVPEKNNE